MKYTIIFLALLILIVPIVLSEECTVTIIQNNISVTDFIEPDGENSNCTAVIRRDDIITDRKNMTRDNLFYNASFHNLEFKGEYTAFINCKNDNDVFFSSCDFVLDDNRLKSMTCPKDNLPEVIMFIFLFIVLIVSYIFAFNVVKFPIVEIVIAVGFLFFSFSLLGCNQLIGMIGIMLSIAMILLTLFKN